MKDMKSKLNLAKNGSWKTKTREKRRLNEKKMRI